MRSFAEMAPVLTYPVCLQASGTKTAYQAFGSNDYSVIIDQGGIIRYSGNGVAVATLRNIIDGLLTTAIPDGQIVPEKFKLEQNYPNPFNPITNISFTLPVSQQVSLTIFNEQGRLVRKLVSGEFFSGRHTISWDGENDRGSVVASGVYYYRLLTNKSSELKKMIMMR